MMSVKMKNSALKVKINFLEFRASKTNMDVRVLADKFNVSKAQVTDIHIYFNNIYINNSKKVR